MHVALVVPGGVDRGGRERVIPALLWLIEGLAAAHRVTVVALGQEATASRYPLLGANVVNVAPEARGPHRLARQLARAVTAVGAYGRPDVVHGFWASVSGLAAVAAGRRYRAPSLVHIAGGELVSIPDIGYGGALRTGGRWIGRVAVRRATDVTVASSWMADHVEASTGRRPALVPLGVDTTRFTPGDPSDAIPNRLVHVASINRVKDQRTLLSAVALVRVEVPDVSLDIVGVDTLAGEIQRLSHELGLDLGPDLGLDPVVRFHDYVPSSQLAPLYRRAQLHVISSRHEAGPVAVLEAAACGVPTVGTRVGHIADFAVGRPPAALAVDVGDSQALANAIAAVLADEGLRRRLADAAQTWAQRNDAVATVAAFEDRYRRLLASR